MQQNIAINNKPKKKKKMKNSVAATLAPCVLIPIFQPFCFHRLGECNLCFKKLRYVMKAQILFQGHVFATVYLGCSNDFLRKGYEVCENCYDLLYFHIHVVKWVLKSFKREKTIPQGVINLIHRYLMC